MGNPHRVGIVGLGNISAAYLETLRDSPAISVTAVADLDYSRSEATAASLGGARASAVDELFAADDVDTVLNLTIPAAHADVALAAIRHGKHVYGEKPLATNVADARAVLDAARTAGVRVGAASDTVLGTGTQTARAALEGGLIGRPLAASAVMVTPGHERWHPNPDFYYQQGGGPLFDMGPYYISALLQLLGPVRSVIGSASRLRSERVITSGPRTGERIPVQVDTHVAGVLEHENGVLSSILTSFDGTATGAPHIEIHGETGTLAVSDPNQFDGVVRLAELGTEGWHDLEASAGYVGAARGVGLIDFANAGPERLPRANGDLALHCLEIMAGLLQSAESGHRVEIGAPMLKPQLVPLTAPDIWRAVQVSSVSQ